MDLSDLPLEELPPAWLAARYRSLAGAYVLMSNAAGTLQDFLEAARDRLRENRPDLALATINRILTVIDQAES